MIPRLTAIFFLFTAASLPRPHSARNTPLLKKGGCHPAVESVLPKPEKDIGQLDPTRPRFGMNLLVRGAIVGYADVWV
jgi:hypothetical protein